MHARLCEITICMETSFLLPLEQNPRDNNRDNNKCKNILSSGYLFWHSGVHFARDSCNLFNS